MDASKTGIPTSYLELVRLEVRNNTLTIASNLCSAKAEDEKNRVDDQCECDGTGDYSAFHALRFVEKQISDLIEN